MADGSGRLKLDFSDSAVGRRLALCAELAHMKRESSSLPAERAKQRQRAHALLRLLLPGEVGGARRTDVLYSRTAAPRMFAEAIESARGGSDAAKVRAGLLLLDLKGMSGRAQEKGSRPGAPFVAFPTIPDDFFKRDSATPGDDPHALPVVNEAKALGALPEGLQAATAKAVSDHNPHGRISNDELRALFPEKYEEFEAASAERQAAYERFLASSDTDEQLARAEWDAATGTFIRLHDELTELGYSEVRRRKDAVAATVTEFADAFASASDVDAEAATEWSGRNVVITKTAEARLKKLGYAPAQVVKDAAEFYRLVRGRIEKVVIDSQGGRRANATDITAHGTAGRINLGAGFDKRVLWHELGHHVEADPVAAAAARLFIRLRSKDDGKLHRLSKLTGVKSYQANEVAYANGFFHPYVGKVYPHGTTEVFSMGLESFSDPFLLAQRIAVDPETFEFVTGYLRSPKTALQSLHLAMRQSMREGQEAATDEADTSIKAVIAREVAKITDFVKADKLPEETDSWWSAQMVVAYGDKVVGYLGNLADGVLYVIAKGRRRNRQTRRFGQAFRFYKIERGASRLPLCDEGFPVTEPEIARLALAAWRQTGIEPRYQYIASGQFTLGE